MGMSWHDRNLAAIVLMQDFCKLQTMQAGICSGKTNADFKLASQAWLA